MKKLIALLLAPVLAGCLTATSPEVSLWNLEYAGCSHPAQTAKYDVVRISQVLVRSPYNVTGIAVLRSNGSVAFDPCNEYAALPSSLMKGVVFEAMAASGLCRTVINPSSSATSSASLEVMATKLALDCRQEGERKAVASVRVRIVAADGAASYAQGDGEFDAKGGNYGAALSAALSTALNSAFKQFR